MVVLFSSVFLWRISVIIGLVSLSISGFTFIDFSLLNLIAVKFSFPLILDPWGTFFSSVVFFISANVTHFATAYMQGDPFIKRFFLLVIFFVVAINMLIFLPNLITLLIGWDGLGLISFLLVIYYSNAKSLGGGIITILSNRIGDAFILIAIAYFINFGVWHLPGSFSQPSATFAVTCITLAAITKSAQLPFSRWLPEAIAAPTPVSALVHSSTLVTAGVFLLFRFYPFLSKSSWFNSIILTTGIITSLMAGLSAMYECDLKKVIALSTLSQLGIIIIRIGLGFPVITFFHIITHALFKALLFICAGTMIHFHHHAQDLRSIGMVASQIPVTTSSITIARLALCGFPFTAGFYSKDLILELSIRGPYSLTLVAFAIASTALTAAYSFRLAVFTLWSPVSFSPSFSYTRENSGPFFIPVLCLSVGATTIGAILNWLSINPYSPFIPFSYKVLPLLVTISGALFVLLRKPLAIPQYKNWHSACHNIFFVYSISSQWAAHFGGHLCITLSKSDQSWSEAKNIKTSLSHINYNIISIPLMLSASLALFLLFFLE